MLCGNPNPHEWIVAIAEPQTLKDDVGWHTLTLKGWPVKDKYYKEMLVGKPQTPKEDRGWQTANPI